MPKHPCVYLLASNRNGTLYIGVTSNLIARVWQHREHVAEGFTAKYDVTRLVWYEQHETMESAILREKRLKKWRWAWKVELVESANPSWRDLWPDILGLEPTSSLRPDLSSPRKHEPSSPRKHESSSPRKHKSSSPRKRGSTPTTPQPATSLDPRVRGDDGAGSLDPRVRGDDGAGSLDPHVRGDDDWGRGTDGGK